MVFYIFKLFCIYLETNENLDHINEEAITTLQAAKRHRVKKILNNEKKSKL